MAVNASDDARSSFSFGNIRPSGGFEREDEKAGMGEGAYEIWAEKRRPGVWLRNPGGAVVRVSKIFIPHMSELVADPRVMVYIGDGFRLLADKEPTYDYDLHQWPASEIFATSEYAYTTIPTYPSGQIWHIVAVKAPGRDLKVAVRDVSGCRYYNRAIHSASFVFPEFTRAMLEEGKDARPVFGRALKASENELNKLLGSGFYNVRQLENELTIDKKALDAAIAAHDLVISLIPYIYHAQVIRAAIKGKKDVVTTSYEAGIIVLNEIGLDPGIDHLYAVKIIDEVHVKGGQIKKYLSCCSGLPAPEYSNNPLGYKFSWSSRGVLLALLNSAQTLIITPAFAFVRYPSRDTVPFREYYGIEEADTIVRSTLRYQGTLVERIKVLAKFPNESRANSIISGLSWIGVFSEGKVKARAGNLLVTLCGRLELMKNEKNERDLVMLHHKFFVEWADGTEQILTSTLKAYSKLGGHSAMVWTVGLSCVIATQLVLDDDICDPIREFLEREGCGMIERAL
ncbi:glyceraldehyde-3-phosphate dehydrogenase-like protein [Coprinopsis marcescibilis]|uniref:Glyceraldehyde-3-phosphate dehydrogenase-like protein n=1 Tax=Coprinopsis marcescibilis TaxID=230819 RepID=A0A5C3KAT7_COPMA|nr:glyceraldehyde-3-phosphate dehydrogenase-like protein [Coprinopsis marcescibilis]